MDRKKCNAKIEARAKEKYKSNNRKRIQVVKFIRGRLYGVKKPGEKKHDRIEIQEIRVKTEYHRFR